MGNSLKITAIRTGLRESILESFDTDEATWLVPDLAAKHAVQEELLKRRSILPEDAVLRANEFWRKLAKIHFPQIDVVSRELIETQIAEWLKTKGSVLARFNGTAGTLSSYIEFFMPILNDSGGFENVSAWLEDQPSARMRWGDWLTLARDAWNHFRDKNCVPMSWVSGFLASHDIDLKWPRRIIVDLDAELSGVETELLRRLTRSSDVEVLTPLNEWIKGYPNALKSYNVLNDGEPIKGEVEEGSGANLSVKRFSTQLAEIKEAVHFVRALLDKGASPSRIGILATEVEKYWPVLASYLDREGIPARKAVTVNAHCLQPVAVWLGRLRIELAKVSKADLEIAAYSSGDVRLKYDNFARLYSRVYDAADIARSAEIKNYFSFDIQSKQSLRRDEFWTWSLKQWSDSDLRGLERISAELLKECPESMTMEAAAWLSYLEKLAARTEITVQDAVPAGIIVGKVDTAKSLPLDHVAFLGLSDAGVKDHSDVAVTQMEADQILRDLGYFLTPLDRRRKEFYVESRIKETAGTVLLTFPGATLSGTAQSPSRLWMEAAVRLSADINEIAVPSETRWDELQKAAASESTPLSVEIDRDLGIAPQLSIHCESEIRYSASQVSNFLRCPFVFTAEKVFRLRDVPVVDLDIDRQSRGRLIHAVLEKVITDPPRFDRTEKEIADLIERCRRDIELVLGDEKLWPVRRAELAKLILRVIEFEKQWRADFPATRTVGTEVTIKGGVEWHGEKFELSGIIDRIDSCGRAGGSVPLYTVIDYKSSGNDLRHHGSWLANDELQLALYAIAVRDGLTDIPPGDVVGAFYFTLNELSRDKGFKVDKGNSLLFSPGTRYNRIEDTALNELLDQVKEVFASVVRRVRAGELWPRPKDETKCGGCTWRSLCRATHLN